MARKMSLAKAGPYGRIRKEQKRLLGRPNSNALLHHEFAGILEVNNAIGLFNLLHD